MSAQWLLPNEEPAGIRFLAAECTGVHMLEEPFKTCRFVPLFGAQVVTTRCQNSIGKSLCAKQIAPEMGVSGRSTYVVA